MPFPRRREISRLEGFSDAVFAFALTLLVVSLAVPASYAELMKLISGFVPFAASFSLLEWVWYEHNLFFRKYFLMGPGHWLCHVRSGRRRRALEARLNAQPPTIPL